MQTKTKQQKRELVRETGQTFNSKNRCTNRQGTCKYYIKGKQGCAIGRLIDDKKLCRKLDKRTEASLFSMSTFELIPLELQAYGQPLLHAIQRWHDDSDNWDENGLTSLGKEGRAEINKLIGEGKY